MTYNGDAAASAGRCRTPPGLTWTGDLTPGAVATITYSVTINNPDTGNHAHDTVTSTTTAATAPRRRRPPLHRTVQVVNADTLTLTMSVG